ncbi:hypothetical protein GCM10011391_22900 [Pullulanibacillus camelliae]|uniref:Uncharacterized protein n=1 Tax=Pullulanibacillus camelliae TaxID=1707096 RepID=A0A8J2YHR7_9BACL|nr:hypothetical protein [Pullulanibacillus camelliae]GGE43567.1 hypothetical protein GCM10011391_22900 [Pullulanibacillus camelliae]
MLGLFVAIIVFNLLAFKLVKHITLNEMIHIWTFTIAFQVCFDVIIELKLKGYWYFYKNKVEYIGLLPHMILVPPINVLFLNWYPFNKKLSKRMIYLGGWVIIILLYEMMTLLPRPWGYFHYGWWNFWYSIIIDPILLFILLKFYKWISALERN